MDARVKPGQGGICYDEFASHVAGLGLRRLGTARVAVIGPGQQVAAAGLVRPIFPGAPGLDRVGAVAPVAGRDLALRQVLDLAANCLARISARALRGR